MGLKTPNSSRFRYEQPTQTLRWILVVAIFVVTIYYIFRSIHWALMVDSPIMHYVVFLIQHGLKPYRDISDNNMPGSYMTEAAAMSIFGTTDFAWRIYEFFLLGALTLAMTIIAMPEDWVAGVFAGGAFLAMHASEGPRFAGEREEVIAVLLMLGYAAMFTAVRRHIPSLLLVLGLSCGIALSIKPTYVPLVCALLALMAVTLSRRQVKPMPYLLYSFIGLAIAVVVDIGYLLHYGVFRQFFFITRTVTPVYRGQFQLLPLLERSIPRGLLPAFLLGAAALVANLRHGERWNWERWALLTGAVVGFASYFVQAKGFQHHRYPYLVFALLLTGLEALRAARTPGWSHWLGAGSIVAVLLSLPLYIYMLHNVNNTSVLTLSLESDLQRLGQTESLQNKVQCFDLVSGCLNALYHLKLVENDGFTGDLLFFRPDASVARDYYRAMYWRLAQQDPGTVLVVGNEDVGSNPGFEKLDKFPQFRTYLDNNYTEVIERRFPMEGVARNQAPQQPSIAAAYRIYIRNQSPLLQAAQRLMQ